MNLLLQISLDYVKLAEEVAKIKEPTTNLEIGVWGLLVLSGWAVAVGLAWFIWKDKNKREASEKEDKKDDKTLWERVITVMTKATLVLESNGAEHKEMKNIITQMSTDLQIVKEKLP